MALACDYRVAVFVRFIITALLFVTLILIATASGNCVKITENRVITVSSKNDRDSTTSKVECSHSSNYQFTIGDWSSLDHKIVGQAFVFGFVVVLFLSTTLLMIYFMCMGPRNERVEKLAAYGSALLCLLCACLEVWYATGFNWTSKPNPRLAVQLLSVTTWAVASAFLFLCSFLFLLDGLMAHMDKENVGESDKRGVYRYAEEPKSPVNHPFL